MPRLNRYEQNTDHKASGSIVETYHRETCYKEGALRLKTTNNDVDCENALSKTIPYHRLAVAMTDVVC